MSPRSIRHQSDLTINTSSNIPFGSLGLQIPPTVIPDSPDFMPFPSPLASGSNSQIWPDPSPSTSSWPSPSMSFMTTSSAVAPDQSRASSDTGSYSRAPLSRSNSRAHYYSTARTVQTPWTSARQQLFEEYITRLTVSAGFPLSWVDNITWRLFVQEFIPGAHAFSRKVLTKRLIPSSVNKLQAQAKASVKGQEVTVQADGWTGLNTHHLIAIMVTAEGKVCMFIPFIVTILVNF
jgi:hypothetical protein